MEDIELQPQNLQVPEEHKPKESNGDKENQIVRGNILNAASRLEGVKKENLIETADWIYRNGGKEWLVTGVSPSAGTTSSVPDYPDVPSVEDLPFN